MKIRLISTKYMHQKLYAGYIYDATRMHSSKDIILNVPDKDESVRIDGEHWTNADLNEAIRACENLHKLLENKTWYSGIGCFEEAIVIYWWKRQQNDDYAVNKNYYLTNGYDNFRVEFREQPLFTKFVTQ